MRLVAGRMGTLVRDAAHVQGLQPRYRYRNPAVTSRHQVPAHDAFWSHCPPLSKGSVVNFLCLSV